MCSTGRRRRGRDLFSALMRGTHETYNQNDSTTAPRPRVPTQRPTQKRPRPKRLATFHAVHYLSTSLRYRLRNCVRQFGQRPVSARALRYLLCSMVPKLELSVPIVRYSAVSFTVSRRLVLSTLDEKRRERAVRLVPHAPALDQRCRAHEGPEAHPRHVHSLLMYLSQH